MEEGDGRKKCMKEGKELIDNITSEKKEKSMAKRIMADDKMIAKGWLIRQRYRGGSIKMEKLGREEDKEGGTKGRKRMIRRMKV